MIKHIWFDMGGTLYKETPAFARAHDELRYQTYAKITQQSNLEFARKEYDALYARCGSNSAVFSARGKPADFWQQAFDALNLANLLTPDPTAASTLAALSTQLPISIFSNFKIEKIKETLDILTIQPTIFTNILSGDDVAKRKPDPEGFYKMIELSGLPAAEIMYVGDRVSVDIEPAKALHMITCLAWQQSPKADYCIQDFAEILQIIK